MSDYLFCSKCGNTTYEVLTQIYRESRIFWIICTNPVCRFAAVIEGKYILEEYAKGF
jgi:hypothetical protein